MTVTERRTQLPRRTELAAFLRSRRERITPEQVGLPPGGRRRTPGLRREELAQLAGVGVTWYTWLEQGRPINASVQVLDAIARTLRLNHAEREHLYRLADVPRVPPSIADDALPAEVQTILDDLGSLPAAAYNERWDILAWNATFAAIFPGASENSGHERNVLWNLFTAPCCCTPMLNRDEELPHMVGTLRAAFGRHLGEPAWEEFVRRLSAASPEFAQMWAGQEVSRLGRRLKIFRHASVGEISVTSTCLVVSAYPDARVMVYNPVDDESRDRIAWLRANPHAPAGCGNH